MISNEIVFLTAPNHLQKITIGITASFIAIFTLLGGCDRPKDKDQIEVIEGGRVVSFSTAPIRHEKGGQSLANRCPEKLNSFHHPFDVNSHWNIAVGQEAMLVKTPIKSDFIGTDEVFIARSATDDPQMKLFSGFSNKERCRPAEPLHQQWASGYKFNLPATVSPPMTGENYTPNNHSAIVDENGNITEVQPLSRCGQGLVSGYTGHEPGETQDNLRGSNLRGAHGGSGMSTLGGTIRLGELTRRQPITHALKIVINPKFLSRAGDGFRDPASKADYDYKRIYKGYRSALQMGSLLTLPSNFNCRRLQTGPGQKVCQALKNYGVYVVDNSAFDSTMLVSEHGLHDEVLRLTEINIGTDNNNSSDVNKNFVQSGSYYNDISSVLSKLHVVDDNRPGGYGGAGPRRATCST